MEERYTFEFIERYLDGSLSPGELQAFQEALLRDSVLAEAVEKQQLAHKASNLYAQLVTKDRVKGLQADVRRRTASTRRRVISLAASVVLLLIAGLGYRSGSSHYSNERLAESVFQSYPDRITTMGDSPGEALLEALSAYKRAEWETASALFEEVPDSSIHFELAQLYLGISSMQAGESLQPLEEIVKKENVYSEAARWYLALGLLKSDQVDQARDQLEKIVEEEGFQHENAQKLLQDLNGFWRKVF